MAEQRRRGHLHADALRSTKYLMSTPNVGKLLADLALEKRSTMVQDKAPKDGEEPVDVG